MIMPGELSAETFLPAFQYHFLAAWECPREGQSLGDSKMRRWSPGLVESILGACTLLNYTTPFLLRQAWVF